MSGPDRWEGLGLTDLHHLNQYAQDKMLSHGYTVPFHALKENWVEAISPGIPDGRHRRLPEWNGFGYNPINPSNGGATGLGIDSENRYGLVYKACGRTGGIYKTFSRHRGSVHQYIQPMQVESLLPMLTPEEPVLGTLNADHCFLRTSEFTNNPRINQFSTAVVTFNDDFTNLNLQKDPLIKETLLPNYMISVVHPPGQIPVLEDDHFWQTTHETRWSYGNIASTTKVFYATRMGCPIPILQWQLKRYNLRLASYSSDAEGSVRMLCDRCQKFQLMQPKPNPYLGWQGCSQCITKTTYIDASGQGPYGAFGILSSHMTFVVGVHLRYRSRVPTLADVLHIVTPNMFPDNFSLNLTPEQLYYLSKRKIGSTRRSPALFSSLYLDKTSWESKTFVLALKELFRLLFPNLKLDDYFVSHQVAYGRPKSFGTPTPLDTKRRQILHANWALTECERFDIGKLTVRDFFTLLKHTIELSLRHQTRLDPETERRYNAEVSSVLFYNFPLLETREYCENFLSSCDKYLATRVVKPEYSYL